MVSISHSGENTEKLKQILATSRKFFSLHGFERTTMKEIAAAMHISKASLYYYFPDKETIFRAVIEAEQEEFFEELAKRLKKNATADLKLFEFVKARQEHFRKFISLDIFRLADFQIIRPHVKETFNRFRKREAIIVEGVLKEGMDSGRFSCEDPAALAELFLEILHGLRMIVMQHRDFHELGKEDFIRIEEKHKAFVTIFILSLHSKSGKRN